MSRSIPSKVIFYKLSSADLCLDPHLEEPVPQREFFRTNAHANENPRRLSKGPEIVIFEQVQVTFTKGYSQSRNFIDVVFCTVSRRKLRDSMNFSYPYASPLPARISSLKRQATTPEPRRGKSARR